MLILEVVELLNSPYSSQKCISVAHFAGDSGQNVESLVRLSPESTHNQVDGPINLDIGAFMVVRNGDTVFLSLFRRSES